MKKKCYASKSDRRMFIFTIVDLKIATTKGKQIMNLNVHFINNRFAEVSVDEIKTGVLNAKEAKELAIHLIQVAAELLELENKE